MAQSTLTKLRRLRSFSNFCCLLGMILSLFAFYVEMRKHQDKSYVALCDINEQVSCSKVFTSKYGNLIYDLPLQNKFTEQCLISGMDEDLAYSNFSLMKIHLSFNLIQFMEQFSILPIFSQVYFYLNEFSFSRMN